MEQESDARAKRRLATPACEAERGRESCSSSQTSSDTDSVDLCSTSQLIPVQLSLDPDGFEPEVALPAKNSPQFVGRRLSAARRSAQILPGEIKAVMQQALELHGDKSAGTRPATVSSSTERTDNRSTPKNSEPKRLSDYGKVNLLPPLPHPQQKAAHSLPLRTQDVNNDLQQTQEALERQLQHTSSFDASLNGMLERLTRLETSLAESATAAKLFEEEIAAKDAQIEELERANAAQETESVLKSALEAEQQKAQKITKLLTERDAEIESLQRRVQIAKQESERADEERLQYNIRMRELEGENGRLQKQASTLSQEVESLQLYINQTRHQLPGLPTIARPESGLQDSIYQQSSRHLLPAEKLARPASAHQLTSPVVHDIAAQSLAAQQNEAWRAGTGNPDVRYISPRPWNALPIGARALAKSYDSSAMQRQYAPSSSPETETPTTIFTESELSRSQHYPAHHSEFDSRLEKRATDQSIHSSLDHQGGGSHAWNQLRPAGILTPRNQCTDILKGPPERASKTGSCKSTPRPTQRPYATDASLQEFMRKTHQLESRLLDVNSETDLLQGELSRLPENGRTLSERSRKAAVESRLALLSKEAGTIRMNLKEMGAMKA